MPANEQVCISVVLPESHPISFSLYDALGMHCSEGQVASASRHSIRISVDMLPPGGYYVQINAGTNYWVKSFSVMR